MVEKLVISRGDYKPTFLSITGKQTAVKHTVKPSWSLFILTHFMVAFPLHSVSTGSDRLLLPCSQPCISLCIIPNQMILCDNEVEMSTFLIMSHSKQDHFPPLPLSRTQQRSIHSVIVILPSLHSDPQCYVHGHVITHSFAMHTIYMNIGLHAAIVMITNTAPAMLRCIFYTHSFTV